MDSRRAWLEAASDTLSDVRRLLAPYGVAIDPGVQVVADVHPCPGYLHQDRAIAFCPPVIESKADQLRWLFFQRFMGCAKLEEAQDFYRHALPLVVCHEASHHLRMSRQVPFTSHFVEEQVCDRLAVAMVEAMPAHRSSLEPLRTHCERMMTTLDQERLGRPGAAFVLDVAEVLVRLDRVSREQVTLLEDIARRRRVSVDRLLGMLPSLDPNDVTEAQARRDLAEHHIDACYTKDPAEYWHLSLTWIASYLARTDRPPLVEVAREHLLDCSAASRQTELTEALWAAVERPSTAWVGRRSDAGVRATRRAAAEALLRLTSGAAAGRLTAILMSLCEPWDGGDLLAALAATKESIPGDARAALDGVVRGLLASPPADFTPESLRLLLRLATARGIAVSGIDELKAAVSPRSTQRTTRLSWSGAALDPFRALDIESIAAGLAHDDGIVAAALANPADAKELLDAWYAHNRPLSTLPQSALADFLAAPMAPVHRRLVLRIADESRESPGSDIVRLAVHELRQGDPREGKGATTAAWNVLRAAAPLVVARQAIALLPLRGSPAWGAFARLPGGDAPWSAALAPYPQAPNPWDATATLTLRALALRADLSGSPPLAAPSLAVRAGRVLAHALFLANSAASIQADAPLAPMLLDCAIAAMRADALRAILEVARDVALSSDAEPLCVLADECWRSRIPPEVARTWIVDRVPEAIRSQLFSALSAAWALDGFDGLAELRGDWPLASLPRTAQHILRLPQVVSRPSVQALLASLSDGPWAAYEDSAMITVLERLVYLRSVPLFARIAPERLEEVAAECVWKEFQTDELVFSEGDRGDEMFIVVAGQVALERTGAHGTVRLALLGSPDCFGEMALFDGAPRSASARALGPCRLLALSGRSLTSIGRENPEVYESFLEVLSARLRRANVQSQE